MTAAPGPSAHPPRVPNRATWNPAAIPDGSMTLIPVRPGVTVGTVVVDPGTGEILGEVITVPPSLGRAARLARRAAAHDARRGQARTEAGQRAARWADVARAGLPVKVPPGLEHLGQPERGLR